MLLEPNIYVTAALLGAVSYCLATAVGIPESLGLPAAVALAFGLRALAILFDLRLPKYGKPTSEDN